jgi:hypothetical protein
MSLSKKWLVQTTYVLLAIVAVTDAALFATIAVAKIQSRFLLFPY